MPYRSHLHHTPSQLLITSLGVACMLLTSACTQHVSTQPTLPSGKAPRTIQEFMTPGQGMRVIAHRGFSGAAPENTLVALRMAMDLKADMAEIDVGLTKDGHVVLLHDETLDRTTDGSGLLSDVTLDEVRQLDAGSWFGSNYTEEPVPTLAEALDLVRGKMLLNVEIKTEAVTDTAESGIVDKVLQLVQERNMLDEVVISSFDPRALAHAKHLDAEVRTASLYNRELHEGQGPLEVMAAVGSNGFNTSHRRITQQMVDACHRHQRPVAIYTVNNEKKMRQMIEMGVDALFTDYPDRLQKVLEEMAAGRKTAAGA